MNTKIKLFFALLFLVAGNMQAGKGHGKMRRHRGGNAPGFSISFGVGNNTAPWPWAFERPDYRDWHCNPCGPSSPFSFWSDDYHRCAGWRCRDRYRGWRFFGR